MNLLEGRFLKDSNFDSAKVSQKMSYKYYHHIFRFETLRSVLKNAILMRSEIYVYVRACISIWRASVLIKVWRP